MSAASDGKRLHRRVRYAPWAAALVPLGCLVAVMLRYSLDMPYLDQWEFVPLLAKSFEGPITLGDLWAQHNEHRLIFPRLIMLALAHLSRWNLRWELAANVVLGTALFLALAHLLRRTAARAGRVANPWLVPLLSLLVFSMSQWENWLLGWQLTEFLNILAAVLGIILLTRAPCRTRHFAGAIALGVVATYSFANGLLYWIVAAPALRTGPAPTQRRRGGLWAVAFLVTAASYLHGYSTPSYHPSLITMLQHPVHFAIYVLKYLGNPLVNWSGTGAAIAGAAGLAVFLGLERRLLRRHGRTPLVAPVALALYAIASAAITGVGRVGFGADQAMSPRYITFANLLWFANLSFVVLASIEHPPEAERRVRLPRAWLPALAVAGLLAFASLYGAYRWTERYHYRIEARGALLTGDDLEMLRRLHPEPEKILERRPLLERHGLTIFAPGRDGP